MSYEHEKHAEIFDETHSIPRWLLRRERLAQLDREGLGRALDTFLELFVGHGLHKTGERVERRWRQLTHGDIAIKAAGHMQHGSGLDADSGLPHYAHASIRVLQLLQLAIEKNEREVA